MSGMESTPDDLMEILRKDVVFYEQSGGGVVWSEDFDSYAAGSSMHGQGGWKGWDNDPTWTAYVSDAQSQSPENSVDIKADADLVHEYDGYTSGYYIYTAYQYIPSDQGEPPGEVDIDGPTSGDANVEYDYVCTAVDPEGDEVRYHLNWGDGESEVTDYYPSGDPATVPHTWTEPGDYVITVKAEDANGLFGPESTLEVTMPRARTHEFSFLQKILEKFPNAFPIIRQILGL